MNFCGSSVAIVTPMGDDNSIDAVVFARLLSWHIEQGTQSVVVAGTTGESPTLSMGEHQKLIADAVAVVGGRVPVIAGVGANSTQEAIELTQQAHRDGASAGLSVVPYYNKPTQEGLYRHYAAIASSSDLPLILYDVPSRCVVGLDDATIIRLAEIDNIVGVKDATGVPARVAVLREKVTRKNFALLSGDDKTSLDYLLAGGDGVISVTANIAPAKMRAMVDAARRGDVERAQALDADMQPFHAAQAVESNPIPVKAALQMAGRIGGSMRLPLVALSERYHREVDEAQFLATRDFT